MLACDVCATTTPIEGPYAECPPGWGAREVDTTLTPFMRTSRGALLCAPCLKDHDHGRLCAPPVCGECHVVTRRVGSIGGPLWSCWTTGCKWRAQRRTLEEITANRYLL